MGVDGTGFAPNTIVLPRLELSDVQVNELCDLIRETCFAIHKYFGPGFREKVYERALAHRLGKAQLAVDIQSRVRVLDEDGTELIEEVMDLIVGRAVIVEVKAVRKVSDADTAQVLGYLRATGFRHGLLANFGAAKFSVRKFVL
jgi:GxxExxY protein